MNATVLVPKVDHDMMTVTVGYFCVFPVFSLVWCTFVVRIDIILQNIELIQQTGDFGNKNKRSVEKLYKNERKEEVVVRFMEDATQVLCK